MTPTCIRCGQMLLPEMPPRYCGCSGDVGHYRVGAMVVSVELLIDSHLRELINQRIDAMKCAVVPRYLGDPA